MIYYALNLTLQIPGAWQVKRVNFIIVAVEVDIKAPMGELDFTIDTQGRQTSIINMQIPDNTNINSLIKTTAEGSPYIFNVRSLNFTGAESELDSWLNALEYDIYDYSSQKENVENQPIIRINPSEKSLSSQLLAGSSKAISASSMDLDI